MRIYSVKFFKFFVLLLVTVLALYLIGGKRISQRDFVGKWQSSRTFTPLNLAANGEWEIQTEDGSILQYGVWRYEGKKIIWTVKQGSRIIDDVNPVLSVKPDEFQIEEQNGTTTVFKRVK